MEKEILKTVAYFFNFSYAPSFAEIYSFLAVKTTKSQLKKELMEMTEKGQLEFNYWELGSVSYTIPPHRIFLDKKTVRAEISQKKLESLKLFIKLIGFLPQIKLLGLSGSMAMANAGKNDDIDLFVITAENRLWTGRFLAILTAKILGLHRKREDKLVKDKICLNLFFEESDMAITVNKRNLYTAHEVWQMKPLFSKNQTYEKFLAENSWLRRFFPNIVLPKKKKKHYQNISKYYLKYIFYIGQIIEKLLKKIQLNFINKNKTKELITQTQLWFFPKDFEDELNGYT